MNPIAYGRELAKAVAVALVAGAVGVGAGFGLAEVRGNDDTTPSAAAQTAKPTAGQGLPSTSTSPPAPAASPPAAAAPTTSPGSSSDPVRPGTAAPASGELDITVISARLKAAVTPDGQTRQRARLSIRVRIENESDMPSSDTRPLLVVGEEEVRVDINAAGAAGALLKPVPTGETVRGLLRFETAGAVTERLQSTRRAMLTVAGEQVPVRVQVVPSTGG